MHRRVHSYSITNENGTPAPGVIDFCRSTSQLALGVARRHRLSSRPRADAPRLSSASAARAARPMASHAEDDKTALLGYSAVRKPRYSFHAGDWWLWLKRDYRKHLDPSELDNFWYRDARGIGNRDGRKRDSWLADLWAFPNWAILSSYFNVGIALMLGSTPISYYLVESLDASAATVNTYSALTYLPWCLKFFYGTTSDLVPFLGMHRRSYFVLGWIIYAVCNAWLAALGTPGTTAVLLLSFGYTAGFMLSDVVADALILECSVGESAADKGRMRTHAYYVRAVGMALGALAGAVLFNGADCGGEWSWGLSVPELFYLQAVLVALTVIPLVPFMYELPIRGEGKAVDVATMWRETFDFLSNDGVWVPLMYLYFYNFCYVSNPAWTNFLFLGLNFTNFGFGMMAFVGAVIGVVGLWAYEKYFFKSEWRKLYLWVTVLFTVFSFLQVCLVTGDTFGLSNYVFAMGDTALQYFVQNLVFMPMCIMFFTMIPAGSEGTVYALLSTWQNVASESGYQLGTYLTCVTNVSDSAIESGNWNGILKLTIICSSIQFLPVFGIYARTPGGIDLLPNSIEATKAQCDPGRKTPAGAWVFFFLFFGSIAFSAGQSFYLAINPDGLCPGGTDDDA